MSAIEQQHGAGAITGANGAASQPSGTRPVVEPPVSGDARHTESVLKELGFDAAGLDALRAAGAIPQTPQDAAAS